MNLTLSVFFLFIGYLFINTTIMAFQFPSQLCKFISLTKVSRSKFLTTIRASSSHTSSHGKESKHKPKSQHHPLKTPAKVRSEPDRPFTLPPGKFRPKQSLGQNYLSDQNYVNKIIDAFVLARSELGLDKEDPSGRRVVEIGPGTGALSRTLLPLFPDMRAIEIDQRAVALLNEKLPDFNVRHQDALTYDWFTHANQSSQGHISIVANLPYHVVSQILFGLADSHRVIDLAVVTAQWEVGARITAPPRTKDYGIPSVIFQLYGKTKLLFKIPPKVFFPVPKVDSALISIDFTKPHPDLYRVYGSDLRQ